MLLAGRPVGLVSAALLALLLPAGARAQAPQPASARLVGRVSERGSLGPLSEVAVTTSDGVSVRTDKDGRFELLLGPGPMRLSLRGPAHEPLEVTEIIKPGQRLSVEYRLMPRSWRQRPFRSTVRGEASREGSRFAVRDDDLRTLAGSLGDPFRVVGMLPGVGTPLPVLPVFVIRGASPGMNGFFIDGMRVPQLFHVLLADSVIHPRFVERLDFYPGGYDASFGRQSGGVIDAGTRPAREGRVHGEAQARIYDVSAALELSLPKDVKLTLSGRYANPTHLIRLVDERASVSYWDYQLRLDWRGLMVQAIGSYDSVNIERSSTSMGVLRRVPNEFRLTFHRVQVRQRGRAGRAELEAALVGGIDELNAFGGHGVRKLSLGFRTNLRATWPRLKIFVGIDGELSRFRGQNFRVPGAMMMAMGEAPDELGELSGDRDGVVVGAFVQGTVAVIPERLHVTLSGRADLYHAGPVTLVGLDPRVQLRVRGTGWLGFHAGFGSYQQPPSFPALLPGIDTFALRLGLQRALHGAAGIDTTLPEALTFSVTGYYQHYFNANDVVIDFGPLFCTAPPPESLSGGLALIMRQLDGHSYGMEVLLRRQRGRVTGWIAYTLSRSERVFTCGLRPADFDQTHVLNLVLQVRLPWRLVASARLFFSTGRPVTMLEPPDGRSTTRNNTRLPEYVQLDLRLDREWRFPSWSLSVFLECVNLTYSQLNFGLVYPEVEGVTNYAARPDYEGFRWIFPSVGLRAHF